MSQPLCERCSRPLSGQAYVCSGCTNRTAEALERIADLAGEVEAAIAKLVRHGGFEGGARDRRPLPVDLDASNRAAAIGNAVATAARDVAESRGIPLPPRPARTLGPQCRSGISCGHGSCEVIRGRRDVGVAIAARWLRGQLEWLRHQRQAAEVFADLENAATDLIRMVAGPLPRWFAGQCWEPIEGVDEHGQPKRCANELYAAPGATTVHCRDCGMTHELAYRKEWLLREANNTLAHAELIARALTALGVDDVTPARVRGMARHGRLVAHGTDRAGRPIYKVGEVLAVIEEQDRIKVERAAAREAKAKRRAEKEAAAVADAA